MVDDTVKSLCYTVDAPTILTKKQLFGCLGMLYYSGGFKGIIIKIIGVSSTFVYYKILTPTLKIERRTTHIELLEIREL